ncbi:MAG: hypothetical protein P4M14_11880 [Gammaproteobacteria bacterium]|nr:hypothetical protein [Gammaproteobacteria bacterium]
MFSSNKETNAKRLAKKAKKDRLLLECIFLKTTYSQYIAPINLIENDLQKATKTAEIDAIEARLELTKTHIEAKVKADTLEKTNFQKRASEAQLAEEKKQLDQRIKNLSSQCAFTLNAQFPEIPLDNLATQNIDEFKNQNPIANPHDPFIVQADLRQFYSLAIQHELQRRETLKRIANMPSLTEEKEIHEQIDHLKANEKDVVLELGKISDAVQQKKQFMQKLAAIEENKVDLLFTHSYQSQLIEHDEIVCAPDGTYINRNKVALNANVNVNVNENNNGQALKAPTDILVTALYNLIKNLRIQTIQKIAAFQPEKDDKEDALININHAILNLEINIQKLADLAKKRKEFIVSRNNLIAKLCLDKNNIAHLQFWSNETDTCFYGYGGKEISVKDEKNQVQTFRIPTRVFKMMEVVQQDYSNAESFERDFNLARTSKPSFFSNPFSFWTRSQLTQMVYKAENIEELQLDERDQQVLAKL